MEGRENRGRSPPTVDVIHVIRYKKRSDQKENDLSSWYEKRNPFAAFSQKYLFFSHSKGIIRPSPVHFFAYIPCLFHVIAAFISAPMISDSYPQMIGIANFPLLIS